MDVTPGLLNGAEQRMLLKAQGFDDRFADTAIAITDIDHMLATKEKEIMTV